MLSLRPRRMGRGPRAALWLSIVALGAFAVGCGEETVASPTGGGGGGPSPLCPVAAACSLPACDPSVQTCGPWECAAPTPCPEVVFIGRGSGTAKPYQLDNPEAAACVLEALRLGTEGRYAWSVTGADVPGQFVNAQSVTVRPDRLGLGTKFLAQDLVSAMFRWGPEPLRDAAHWEACLASASAATLWDCLDAWSEGCP